jgi:hypothetical protein
MQDDDIDDYICGLEAQEILAPASDYLLRRAAEGQIDLNKIARFEYRGRLEHQATLDIIEMQRRAL